MEQAKPDVRTIDVSRFSDDAIQHAIAFLLGGVKVCSENEHDPLQEATGKLLLGLAMALGFDLPPDPPAPPMSSLN